MGERGRPALRAVVAFFGMVVIAVLVVGAVFALSAGTSKDGVAEAREFLLQVPDRVPLTQGQVLHLQVDVYHRYGPKAADIAARNRISTETHIRESWQEAGSNDTIVRSYATLTDDRGAVVQESRFQSGRLVEVDPRTGLVLGDAPPPGLENGGIKVTAPAGRAKQIERDLAEGRARLIRHSADEIVTETRVELPAHLRTPQNGNAYQIPYVADLSPVALKVRITIRSDGIVTLGEMYAISQSGEETLVQSERVIASEVLPVMPDGLF